MVDNSYNFETETTHDNLYRLLRAMQLSRPILLEGSPGVGKTTLIEAMSQAVGKTFIRINLSDQTDMMDLLGANLPSPEGEAGEFVWSDGPLLQAMKTGSWVLLDELNLAGQSILEGLNALLDHRGEIFVPELNTVVKCAPGFRLFGAQNPVQEGGGRKGLPRSFLNRFIRVRISAFSFHDLLNISRSMYARVPVTVIRAMTECLWQCASKASYRGQSTLDFNLRDLLRWCKLVQGKLDVRREVAQSAREDTGSCGFSDGLPISVESEALRWSRFYGNMLMAERMRSSEDRQWIEALLDEQLVHASAAGFVDRFEVGTAFVKIGNVDLRRKPWDEVLRGGSFGFTGSESGASGHTILKSYFGVQESLSECVKNNWLSILVGSNGTGRSSSVAALAHLMGKRLVEIPMHAGIDISDLLGGFEQVDAERESFAVLRDVKTFLRSLAVVALHEGQPLESLRDLWHDMFDRQTRDLHREARAAVATLADNLESFQKLIGKLSRQRGGPLSKDLDDLNLRGERFIAREARAAGKFEWVDGTLTRCILDGSWVILRDANLCNPSVLDRLNPLFEPEGFISLNECGSTDAGARAIVPHPEFRMFITYDPVSGEISRAMRNRGIEISMAVDASTGLPLGRQGISSGVSDVVAVMVANGLPGPVAQELAQRWLSDTSGIPSDRKSIQYLAKWSRMIDSLVGSGLPFGRAMELAYMQCFNCVVPMDLGVECDVLLDHTASDTSDFIYPSLEDISGGSRMDARLATWGYVVELGRGGGPLVPPSPECSHLATPGGCSDEWLDLLEEHGALAAMSVSAFAWSVEVTNSGEDMMNAAMAICQSHAGAPALVAAIMGRISTTSRFPELGAWKSFLAGTGAGPWTTSHVVRTALEGCRMAQLAEAVPECPTKCLNLLETAAWCHAHPFSQDHQLVKDASLLRCLWVAIEALYASVHAAATEESCDALSLFRRIIMTDGKRLDRERLAHAWQRLVDSLRLPGSPAQLPSHGGPTSTLIEKVSGMLRGPTGGTAPECADAFIEIIGRPLVALNFGLHDALQQCHAVAKRLQTHRGILETYRETGKEEDTILLSMSPGPRAEVLEVLRIVMAGSITDPRSLPRIRRLLAQLQELVQTEVLVRKEMLDRNSWDARIRLLRHEGAVEQLGLVDELLVRRQETVLALKMGCVSSLSNEYTPALSECLEASRHLFEAAAGAIASMPSRTVSDCLPFRVLLDYHDVLMARGDGPDSGVTDVDIQSEDVDESRVMKGLRMMALLQVHRDLWSPQLLPARHTHLAHAERGPASLHQCGVTSSLIQLMNQGKMPSLRNRAARVMQIERCFGTVLPASLGVADDLAALEWKTCLVTTIDMIRCIDGSFKWDASVDPSLDPCKRHAAAVAMLEGATGVEPESANLLKQSLDLLLLHNSKDGSTASMINRGKAFALSSLVQLHLSRPHKAYDPSLAGEMERDALSYSIEHFYMPEKRIRESYWHLPLSERQLEACDAIDQRVAQLEGRRGAISRLTSARPPEKSQYLELRDDISEFLSHLGDPSRIRKLLEALQGVGSGPGGAAARSQAELWCDNAHAFIEGINAKYPCYKDIIGPVELSLRGVQYGVGLMCSARVIEEVGGAEALVRGLLTMPRADASFIADGTDLDKVLDVVHRDASDPEGRSLSVLTDKLRLLALRVDAVRASLEHADSPGQRAALRDEFERIGLQIHGIWVEMVEQEKARLAEEEALYEVKARKLDMSKDDLQLQHELTIMFPEHASKLFDDLARDDADEVDGDGDGGGGTLAGESTGAQKVGMERKKVSNMVLDAVYAAFCALNALECGVPPVPQDSALVNQAARFSMGVDMASQLQATLSSEVDAVSIPGFSYMLAREWHALTAVPDALCDGVDMYSPNVEEASRVQKPIELILSRLEQLLDEWPDHPILDQLRRIGVRLLDMPLDCPLKSYSTGVELLLNKSQVWEETAAKHVALDELLKPLVSIAAHWRKAELNGWKDIVLKARQDVSKGAREAWFFIFGIIHEDFGSLADFINAMDSFVQGSPVGQYRERLALLLMFSSHLSSATSNRSDRRGMDVTERNEDDDDDDVVALPLGAAPLAVPGLGSCRRREWEGEASKRRTLSLVLGNLCKYYEQFQPTIDARIAADMKPLEKELADFVKLAKWEDRGFYAMKAAADKAHTQLCKIVRKVKDALGIPASTCLRGLADQIGIGGAAAGAGGAGESATAQLLRSLEGSIGPISVNIPRGKVSDRLSESQIQLLGKYSQRVDGIADTFRRMAQGKDGAMEEMRSLAAQMEGLATAALTQAAALRDDVSRGAKARKKKALSDFFKALEGCGVSKLQSAIPVGDRDPSRWMKVDYDGVSDATYYFESVARLTRLRELSLQPHLDVQAREVHMANNMVTHAVYLAQETRAAIAGAAPCAAFLKGVELTPGSSPSVASYEALQERSATFLNEAARCIEWMEGRRTLIPSPDGDLSRTIGSWVAAIDRLRAELAGARPAELHDVDWTSHEMAEVVRKAGVDVLASLPDLPFRCPAPLRLAADGFLAALREASSEQRAGTPRSSRSWSQFACAYEGALRACMVWAQQEETGAHWATRRTASPSLLAIQRVRTKVKALLDVVQRLDDGVPTHGVELLLSQLSPLARAVGLHAERAVRHLEARHRAVSKLSYVSSGIFCSLIQNGFCVPNEEEVEGEREEAMDGTGLGDGDTKGAKDISDELEDQDQLLSGGLGEKHDDDNDRQDEEEKGEDREEDKGVEMDDDFEGVEEVVERKEDEEDEEEDEEEEEGDEDQLDQQMGDADGDAVDEKAWDNDEERDDDKTADGGDGGQDKLEFAQGDENDDYGDDDRGDQSDEKGEEEAANENEEDGYDGEYEENVDTGFLEQEKPDEPLELPEDMQLEDEDDGGDGGEEEGGEGGEGEDDEGSEGGEDDEGSEGGEEDDDDRQDLSGEMNEDVAMQNAEDPRDDAGASPPEGEQIDEKKIDPDENADADTNTDRNADRNVGVNDDDDDDQAAANAALENTAEAEAGREDAEALQEAPGALGDADGKAVDRIGDKGEASKDSKDAPNPFRSVESAAERWEKKHANVMDLAEDEEVPKNAGGEAEDAKGEAEDAGVDPQQRFLREGEDMLDGDDRVMADATEEQVAVGDEDMADGMVDGDDEEEERNEEREERNEEREEGEGTEAGGDSKAPLSSKQMSSKGEREEGGEEDGEERNEANGGEEQDEQDEQDEQGEQGEQGQQEQHPVVVHLGEMRSLSLEDRRQMQAELEERLSRRVATGDDSLHDCPDDCPHDSQKIWETCCQLTSQLSAELAEQLRLVLEPTRASKLGGEYRSGKRINMKRVIGYIARCVFSFCGE